VASIETGHWFATPFAMLFAFGYGYVALFVTSEELGRRKTARLQAAAPLPAGLRAAEAASADVSSDEGEADVAMAS